MPQMMPMNWLMLMFTFSLIMLLTMIMNFYYISYHPLMKNKKNVKISFNWMW